MRTGPDAYKFRNPRDGEIRSLPTPPRHWPVECEEQSDPLRLHRVFRCPECKTLHYEPKADFTAPWAFCDGDQVHATEDCE